MDGVEGCGGGARKRDQMIRLGLSQGLDTGGLGAKSAAMTVSIAVVVGRRGWEGEKCGGRGGMGRERFGRPAFFPHARARIAHIPPLRTLTPRGRISPRTVVRRSHLLVERPRVPAPLFSLPLGG
jgi:hypothetical protein